MGVFKLSGVDVASPAGELFERSLARGRLQLNNISKITIETKEYFFIFGIMPYTGMWKMCQCL
ncbi:MAG TPA: hypothetical protein DCE76_04945 [Anaerolineaceae bacterium]|nr:hypothetical protein [Anaerolineaceae bacterium]